MRSGSAFAVPQVVWVRLEIPVPLDGLMESGEQRARWSPSGVVPLGLGLLVLAPLELAGPAPLEPAGLAPLEIAALLGQTGTAPLELAAKVGG